MDKNTLANAILINKLTDSKKDLEKSIKEIKKELPTVVERLFAGLNAESKLDAVLAEVNKDYINKLGIELKDLKAEMQKIIVDESGKAKDKLIAQYKKDIASIKKPKDGKDYILTKKDLKEISKLVEVEIPDIPEVKEKTAEELLALLKLRVEDIDGLEERLKELKKKSGKNTVVGGGGNRFLKNLVDVDLSGLSIVDGKYVLGSGSGGGGGAWGSITGTLSDQTDLQTALDLKANDSEAVKKSDYTPAHSILVQQSGTGTPEALQVSNNTIIGRQTGGGSEIADLTPTQVKYILDIQSTDISDFDTEVSNNTSVVANTAKVSFPEAPEDGKQYARIDGTWVEVSSGGGSISSAVFQDQKAGHGGTSTTSWLTRDLNTTVYNDISGVSLSSNQITLPAGTYSVDASTVMYGGGGAECRLYNVTDSSVEIIGSTESSNDSKNLSIIGAFTTTSEKVFTVDVISQSGAATQGLGRQSFINSGQNNVYTTIKLIKLS